MPDTLWVRGYKPARERNKDSDWMSYVKQRAKAALIGYSADTRSDACPHTENRKNRSFVCGKRVVSLLMSKTKCLEVLVYSPYPLLFSHVRDETPS